MKVVRDGLAGLWAPYAAVSRELAPVVGFVPSWLQLLGREPVLSALPEQLGPAGELAEIQFRKAVARVESPQVAEALTAKWNTWVRDLAGRVDWGQVLAWAYELVGQARQAGSTTAVGTDADTGPDAGAVAGPTATTSSGDAAGPNDRRQSLARKSSARTEVRRSRRVRGSGRGWGRCLGGCLIGVCRMRGSRGGVGRMMS